MMVTIHQSLKRRVYNPDRLLNGIITQIIPKYTCRHLAMTWLWWILHRRFILRNDLCANWVNTENLSM